MPAENDLKESVDWREEERDLTGEPAVRSTDCSDMRDELRTEHGSEIIRSRELIKQTFYFQS